MTTVEPFVSAAVQPLSGSARLGERIGAIGRAMGPHGRRFAVTAAGAVLALGFGVATASAFRLPPEITDPSGPQDQTMAQSELPSEEAARAYALNNPPTYAVSSPRDVVDPALPDASPRVVPDRDDPSTTIAYTTPTYEPPTDETPANADQRPAAQTAPAWPPAPADAADQDRSNP